MRRHLEGGRISRKYGSQGRLIGLSGLKVGLKCSYVHSRAIQCEYTPYSAVLSTSGKGRQRSRCVRVGYSPFFTYAWA